MLSVFALGLMGGCGNGFLDPAELGAYPKHPLTVNILKSLDTGVEEANSEYANATDITPDDLIPPTGDVQIGKNDLLSVSITDLVQPGVQSTLQPRVTESGKISLPLIQPVQASGLTESQLQTAITQAYKDANLMPNAQVSVSTLSSQGHTFNILGAVNQVGQYQILQNDFRLLDALSLARNPVSTYSETAYVIRRTDQSSTPSSTTKPNTDVLTPRTSLEGRQLDGRQTEGSANRSILLKTEARQDPPATQPADSNRMITIEGQSMPAGAPAGSSAASEPMPMDQSTMTTKPFEFQVPPEAGNTRVIRIPLDKLLTDGQFSHYNIVIRAGDMIYLPLPSLTGVYYMGGHVTRTGAYSFSGTPITLSKAIVSAGMFDQVAVPSRTQVVRTLKGQNKQIFATVDVVKIFAGEAPDIFLKPDDMVMVGTTPWAPFLAALRNGFRITYGFGFLYDRNYNTSNNNGN